MKFPTSVTQTKTHIIERGYDNGERFQRVVDYKPYAFEKVGYHTGWTTAWGDPVKKIKFDTMKGFTSFIYANKNSKDICGFENVKYLYLNDEYPTIDYDRGQIGIFAYDIECESDLGFPEPEKAERVVNALTINCRGKTIALGLEPYTGDDKSFEYIHCDDEAHLLKMFLYLLHKFDPDIITGWNVLGFDNTYMYNRIVKILGVKAANAMSPLGICKKRKIKGKFGKDMQVIDIEGISTLDYMELYQKFNFSPRESYKLDHIAFVELGQRKLDFGEASSLYDLYKTDWNKYVDYNVQDVRLINRLDEKLDYMSMALAVAYEAKVNYREVLGTVALWDTLIHNDLLSRKIVVPMKADQSKGKKPEGGYVREPDVGMHDWVVSFDLNSLYPSLIRQFNISPEKRLGTIPNFPSVDDIINNGAHKEFTQMAVEKNVAITGSGEVYSIDDEGFLGRMMRELYSSRVMWKGKLKEAKKEYEKNPSKKLKEHIERCNSVQHSKKILLNSLYGALGNAYFRWFDNRHVEAVTLSGQMAVRRVEKCVNEYIKKTYDVNIMSGVYGDTDSAYFKLDKIITKNMPNATHEEIVEYIDKEVVPGIEKAIEDTYDEMAVETNSFDNVMVMKRETICSRGIWTAKKRYALNVWDDEGFRYDKPKLKITGLEPIRSSTPTYARKAIEECLVAIMNTTEDDLHKKIEEVEEEFKNAPPADIAFSRGISNVEKYTVRSGDGLVNYTNKRCPIHAKAAIIFNRRLQLNEDANTPPITGGDKMKFIYMKEPNPLMENVLGFPSYFPEGEGLEEHIDFELQYEKAVLKPLRKILDCIGWTTEPKNTIESLF